MTISNSQASIESLLTEFLAEQRGRLSDRTFHRYQEVVQLLRHSLDRYAYTSLDADERRRWDKEFESNEEGAFCRLFGPEKIPPHLGEFLDYFMVRKVFARPGAAQGIRHRHRQARAVAGRPRLH
jgi:hypothetical protein